MAIQDGYVGFQGRSTLSYWAVFVGVSMAIDAHIGIFIAIHDDVDVLTPIQEDNAGYT